MMNLKKPLLRSTSGDKTCLDICWEEDIYATGEHSSTIFYPIEIKVTTNCRVAIVAFGGSKINPVDCAANTTYVTIDEVSSIYHRAFVDVWKAYADGLWTSSTDIEVWALYTSGTGTISKTCSAIFGNCDTLTKSVSVPRHDLPSSCAYYGLMATVTVNEDGTHSLA
jgi:hypothetical protein